MRIRRRALLLGLVPSLAFARGRLPSGGKLSLRVPWPLASIDPHAIDDAAAALFGGALFDSLYAQVENKFVPALAESEPEVNGGDLRVKMRANIASALSRPIGAREAIFSITRAKGAGASGWLADIPIPRRDGETLVFAFKDKDRLMSALASPLCSILPMAFSSSRADGTGAFRMDGKTFARNDRAARGPSLLDSIDVSFAPDLSASLRAFEAGSDDLGWLGSGLHGARSGSKPFDAGFAGWTILRTGKLAGGWDAPGVAQRLCDGMDPGKLAYLVPGSPWTQAADTGWGGAPCDLVVRNDAPYLVEVARAVAAVLTRAGHEVKVSEISPADFQSKRASKSYALAIDVARPMIASPFGTMIGLAQADDPSLAADIVRHPPKVADVPARSMTRTMRIGVIGEIRVQGGRLVDTTIPSSLPGFGWDLAMTTRGERR